MIISGSFFPCNPPLGFELTSHPLNDHNMVTKPLNLITHRGDIASVPSRWLFNHKKIVRYVRFWLITGMTANRFNSTLQCKVMFLLNLSSAWPVDKRKALVQLWDYPIDSLSCAVLYCVCCVV